MEFCKSAMAKDEARKLGKSYVFHIDTQYMSDIGCLFRVCFFGHTLEVYRGGSLNVRSFIRNVALFTSFTALGVILGSAY